MAKERSFNWRMVSEVCGVVAVVGGVLIFFVKWSLAQDGEIVDNSKSIERIETSYGEHVKSSEACFRKLDRTLEAQQKLIAETRETMSAVRATQVSIKEENGRLTRSVERLAEEIRKANGGPR